jgi:hypothetical protein
MTQAADAQDARHRYIDVLRSMNPDPEMKRRLDLLEQSIDSAPKVTVTRADLRDVISPLLDYVSHAIDEVVDEVDGRLGLIGEHPMTTSLRPDTVQEWIRQHIDEDIGRAELTSIIEDATS